MIDTDEPVRSYWRRRLEQHTSDSYMGAPMLKFPEDLRVYERLLWDMQANVVVELGVAGGGSTLWFRDRLRALADHGRITSPLVVAVDVAANPGLPDDVVFLQADITDPALPDRVAGLLPAGARPFVVEDTAHEYETTWAALTGFARFVPPEGFFVVEDGVVDLDDLRVDPAWPRGVSAAIRDWLATNPGFVVRRDLELYGLTCHPGGFLQRSALS